MEKAPNNSPSELDNDLASQMNKLSLKQEKIGYVFDERMLLHKNFADNHVERPERAMSIYMNLYFKGLLEHLIRLPSEEIKEDDLERIHTREYIDKVADLRYDISSEGKKSERKQNENKFRLCYDSYDNYNTYQSARVSAGSLLSCCRSIVKKKVDHAFAIIRPPGHHSNTDHCRGFCFFNNVAIAADYLIKDHKMKIAIVDWDVHHGDGTQEIFYKTNNPLMVSLHRHDNGTFYPNTGKHTDSGEGKGAGFTINIPWNTNVFQSQSKASIGDDEYFYAFETIVIPVLKEYKPDIIIVSCGFDAAENDPLGRMALTPLGYAMMTHKLKSIGSNLLVALEGGYNINSLSRCSEAIIRTLLNEPAGFKDLLLKQEIKNLPLNLLNINHNYFASSSYAIDQINSIKNYLIDFWPSLKQVNTIIPKRKIIRKDDDEQINKLKIILQEKGEYILDTELASSLSDTKNETDFIKFRIGTFSERHGNLSVKNYHKKINVANKSISAISGFRLEGINLKISTHKHSFNEKHFNWTGKDGIYDANLESVSYLVSKFLVSKKIKKKDLIDIIKSFSKDYETLFIEKKMDLLNVDIIIIPMEVISNEKSKFKKVKVNLSLKLNGIKSYSIIHREDTDITNNNFYSGLTNLTQFLNENLLE